jgi:hypothetical protein
MRRLILSLLLLTPSMQSQNPHPLATLVDNTRALLVFAPSEDDPRFVRQQSLLRDHAAGMADRNLILIPVLGHWQPSPSANSLRNENVPFSNPEEQRYMRRRFKVPAGSFAVVLIGKDGGEKLRQSRPIDMPHLAAIIDAMPMRQQEMRERPHQP